LNRKKTNIEIAKSWCFENEIFIYPVPITTTTLKIEVDNKGKTKLGKQIFQSNGGKKSDPKWWNVINKLYLDYHKRLKDESK